MFAIIFAKNSDLLASDSLAKIGNPFIQLSKVDSTNNYAMAQIHNGLAKHGSTYFASCQTAGKGQRGKAWKGSEGLNIAQTSVINGSAFSIGNPFELTVVVANACCEFFSFYAGHETMIKWPNDIYWRDRKAGGILIENIIRGSSWLWAVIGIGFNINQTAFSDLPNPVSLKQITGKTYESIELGRELCNYLEKHYQIYLTEGFEPAYQYYGDRLYKRGEMVHFKKENMLFECRVARVEKNGDLSVDDCSWDKFGFGEVEWIIQ